MNKINTTLYMIKANNVIRALQQDGPMISAEYATVLGMVAAKVVKAMVEHGEDKQKAIDAICKSVQIMSM